MALDIRTIYFNAIYLNLIMTLYLCIVWLNNRRDFKGVHYFLLAMVSFSIGTVGIWLRGQLAPFFSIIAANMFTVLGMVLMYHAFLLFYSRKRTKWIWAISIIVPSLYFLEQYYFGLVVPDLSFRILFTGFVMLFFTIFCLQLLISLRKQLSRPGLLFIFALSIQFFVFFSRIVYSVSTPNITTLFQAGTFQAIIVIGWTFSIGALPIGFSLLIAERLRNREAVGHREKRILLQELYHRTKNNMQMIASFLALQRNRSGSSEVRQELQEAETRIHTVAFVHKKLYQAADLSNLRLDAYLKELAEMIFKSFNVDRDRIFISVESIPLIVDIDMATPIGLIFNELCSNALEHAFPEGKGSIFISISKDGDQLLCVFRDNGIGYPKNFDMGRNISLGLMTVKNLTETQLHGIVECSNDQGALCKISFPIPVKKPFIEKKCNSDIL